MLVYPVEAAGAFAAEPLPDEYQSFVEAAAGACAGGAQLEAVDVVVDDVVVVVVVELFGSGDPQSSQVSLSVVSAVPVVGVVGETDEAYGLEAPIPLFMLSLPVVAAEEL